MIALFYVMAAFLAFLCLVLFVELIKNVLQDPLFALMTCSRCEKVQRRKSLIKLDKDKYICKDQIGCQRYCKNWRKRTYGRSS